MDHPVVTHLRRQARRLIIYPLPGTDHRVVYQVRRVRTEELTRAGFQEMVGARVKAAAEYDVDHELEITRALDALPEDASEEQTEAARVEAIKQIEIRQLEVVLGGMETVEGRREYLAQLEAYLMAAVEAAGMVREGLEVPLGLQPRDTTPADLCAVIREDNGEPIYLLPLRFVGGDVASDEHQMPLSELSFDERFQLGMLVMSAVLDNREVRPFRHEPPDGG